MPCLNQAGPRMRCASKSGAVAVAMTGEGWLGLTLLLIEVVVVLAMRQLGMVRRARALADQRIEALRLRGPAWLKRG